MCIVTASFSSFIYVYLLGEKEKRNVTTQKMVKTCGLKHMWIVARPAYRQSDGTFSVRQNSPIVLSNRITTGI